MRSINDVVEDFLCVVMMMSTPAAVYIRVSCLVRQVIHLLDDHASFPFGLLKTSSVYETLPFLFSCLLNEHQRDRQTQLSNHLSLSVFFGHIYYSILCRGSDIVAWTHFYRKRTIRRED